MGWTSDKNRYPSNFRAFVAIEGLDPANVVAHSTHGKEVYIAYRNDDSVVALVGLVEKRDGYTWSLRMDENTRPFRYNPSIKVLSALTPTQHEGALLWRQACREQHAAKKKKTSLVIGQTVRVVDDIPLGPYRIEAGDTVTFVREKPRAKYRLIFDHREIGFFRFTESQFRQHLAE